MSLPCYSQCIRIITVCLVSFLVGITVSAQQITLEVHPDYQYTQYHLGREEGLRGNLVHNLLQDKKGYIWLVANGWVQRYNGAHFETFFKIPDIHGFGSKLILAKDGKVWVFKLNTVDYPFTRTYLKDLWIISPESGEVLTIDEVWSRQKYTFEKSAVTAVETGPWNTSVLFGLADGKVVEADAGGKVLIEGTGQSVSIFAANQKGMIAVNRGTQLELFDPNGNYLSTYKLEKNIFLLRLNEEGEMLYDKGDAQYHFIFFSGQQQEATDFNLNMVVPDDRTVDFLDTNYLISKTALLKKGEPIPLIKCSNCPNLFLDRQENVWISDFSGITVVRPELRRFTTLLTKYHAETRGILPLNDSLLLIHSFRGSFVIDLQDSVRMYNPAMNSFIGIARDGAGGIWEGTYGPSFFYIPDYQKKTGAEKTSGYDHL